MNEAIDLLNSLIQQAAQLADQLSEEEMEQVLSVFQDAIEILQQNENIVPTTSSAPEVSAGQFPSSNVNGFKYDPKTQELLVQFHGPYPQAEGPVYSYQGVPKFIYSVLERGAVGPKTSGKNRYHEWVRGVTPSYGAVINSLVKAGGYSYRKVS